MEQEAERAKGTRTPEQRSELDRARNASETAPWRKEQLLQQRQDLARIHNSIVTLPQRMPKLPPKVQVDVHVVQPVSVRVNNNGYQTAVTLARRTNQTFIARRTGGFD